ncbi:hypothetical protein D5S17_28865 [Pseudonocardiaceae bacterium YIM PH 21723]|nr:hypothetical protein D5S17_28865 [Pseudonocardiaceae bacterium YIM PH 21723]
MGSPTGLEQIMTKDKARKQATRARAAAGGTSYTAAHFTAPNLQADAEQPAEWSGIDWYAFPPKEPKEFGRRVMTEDQRYYWTVRRRWPLVNPRFIGVHARMASKIDSRPRHLADWWLDGPTYGGWERRLALDLLYVVALHERPELLPDAELLAELVAAGEPMPVDAAFAELDRYARLLMENGWWESTLRFVERARAILEPQAATHDDPRAREFAASLLGQVDREFTPYDYDSEYGHPLIRGIGMSGALQTLDAMLCSSQGGFPPGTVVQRHRDGSFAVVGKCLWSPTGGSPTHYALGGEDPQPAAAVHLPPGTVATWMTP